MALYLVGAAIPALVAGKGASDRMDSKAFGVVVGIGLYLAVIASLFAFGKFDA